jgi:phage N-6-adenine-methyltransferase
MSLVGFQGRNHPQQVTVRGADDDVDDRATTPADFAEFDRQLGPFTLDVAASHANAKCARYFTREQNGLALPWAGATVWCNPPYSDIAPWVRKAWAEFDTTHGIAMLLPANRTEQTWWQELIERYRDSENTEMKVVFLPGRMRFLKQGETTTVGTRPPFGCCLVTWGLPRLDTTTPNLFDQ